MNDEQLNEALAGSRPPKPSPALDERVMNSYRNVIRRPFWPTLLYARIRIPVPVVLLVAALFVGSILWRWPRTVPPPQVTFRAPVPPAFLEIPARPQPLEGVMDSRRPQAVAPAVQPRGRTNLAWSPVARPEWRIVQ